MKEYKPESIVPKVKAAAVVGGGTIAIVAAIVVLYLKQNNVDATMAELIGELIISIGPSIVTLGAALIAAYLKKDPIKEAIDSDVELQAAIAKQAERLYRDKLR